MHINKLHNLNSQRICFSSYRAVFMHDIFTKLTSINKEEMAMPCTYEFSRGYGTGVAEALGNWGFSNGTCSAGQELQRLKCLFAKMDSL